MSIDLILNYTVYGFAIAYALLAVVLFVRRTNTGPFVLWGLGFLLLSAVWQLSVSLFASPLGPLNTLTVGILAACSVLLLPITAAYVGRQPNRLWVLGAMGLFLGAILLEIVTRYQLLLVIDPVFRFNLTPGLALALIGWLAVYVTTISRSFYNFRSTASPAQANRYLYWGMCLLVGMLGEVLIFLNQPVAILFGYMMRFVAGAGIMYAAITYVRFDVRVRLLTLVSFLIRTALVLLIPATGIYLIFTQIQSEQVALTSQNRLILSIIASTIVIVLFIPFYQVFGRFIRDWIGESKLDTNTAVRLYSQAIAGTPEVRQLASRIFEQLDANFGISRASLILISAENGDFVIEPVSASREAQVETRQLSRYSPFIDTLTTTELPISQYEIDYNPNFGKIPNETREWLSELSMELYAPVRSDDELKGFIAIGPKRSGFVYRHDELNVIQLLADQTVAALDNARLYSELGEQNEYVRHLNESLVRQNGRLETMDKAKSDFITIASHELRTPLTQIKGFTDILTSLNEEDALSKEQARHIIAQVERAAGQLEGLISAMLDASQIDVDEMKLNMTQAQLDMIFRLSAEPLSQAIKSRRINLTIQPSKELPFIRGDFKRLVQAFSNILGNAVKYTPDNGHITVSHRTIEQDADTDFIEIAITDTGIGLDPAYHQLIFEKFFRLGDPHLHSTGSTKFMGAGPGLGLTIARGVIEGHGGRIWVESEGEDKNRMPGSTFYVLLPIPKAAEETPEIEHNPPLARSSAD